MPKSVDTYEQWARDGVLEQRLTDIQQLTSKRILQKDVAKVLCLSEKTLIKLKKVHPRLNQAFIMGDDELKFKLVDKIYEKAMGFEYEEIQTIIEETKTGTKKRIVKSKKQSLPDFTALRYLLVIKFGREFNEKKEELELMEKRLERGEEVWINENRDDETSGAIRVRKQSPK